MSAPLPSYLFGGSAEDARRGGSPRGGSRKTGDAGILGKVSGAIHGVPERFMRPRIVLVAVTAVLVCFGMLMIYSASSVSCLNSASCDYDPAYYLKRQMIYAAVGLALAVLLATRDYHWFTRDHLAVVVAGVIVALILVFVPGFSNSTYGASRWIKLGGFQLQPSEFAKVAIVTVAAALAQRYYVDGDLGQAELLKYTLVGIGVPLGLILIQPDKGSTAIIAITLIIMLYVAGFNPVVLSLGLLSGALALGVLSLTQDYALSRITTFLDPWADEAGKSYQLVQGYYALGSGGILGVGIGFSKQKYSYLPMAHNDFIFAVIGEECGLVGTLGVIACFALFAWAGFRIAKYAPDLAGRLIASGCTSLIIIQMLVNVCGVLGLIPLSGKPLPFLSYGGTSIIACLMFVGMLLSVSKNSALPETEHDVRRRNMTVRSGDERGDAGLSFVGETTPRSASLGRSDPGAGRSDVAPTGFTVVDGGGSARDARGHNGSFRNGSGASRASSQRIAGGRGYGRIDTNADAASRQRSRGSGRGRSGGQGRSGGRERRGRR
ncbi:putative lipid II flippase FtsW [Paratractidigestivibacter sp.]|uniref:putative lipid II flippase FtsW n=1 Tax=Paratractidigestivibacter sp. TaxID=2847316 RepID=UPI002AC8D71A|nr:putative lipid II flippase FtsW [Paratractidigestivibacter sp.]